MQVISVRLANLLQEIPVYPEEVSLKYLRKRYGAQGLPTDAPIGEDCGKVCYPSQQVKNRYMESIWLQVKRGEA